MSDLIKQYWKAVLAIVYAIAVPLYFYSTNVASKQALEASRQSSNEQIKVLEQTIKDQQKHYEQSFEEYKALIQKEEERHQEQIKKIQETQAYHQALLTQRFQQNPQTITDELKKRYGLNGN